MNKSISINTQETLNNNVKVFKVENVLIAHVGEPVIDKGFNQPFRTVKFVRPNGTIMTNSIFDGRVFRELADAGILVEGKTVELRYELGSGWIKSIDGKEWH